VSEPWDINNPGQVVGGAEDVNGKYWAFLLTPGLGQSMQNLGARGEPKAALMASIMPARWWGIYWMATGIGGLS
jgi:probable HAF family extracellular repeat protein